MPDESCLSSPIAGKADLVAEDITARAVGRRVDGPIGALAARQHGVVARRQLRGLGIDDSAIDSRLRRGALLALHRGVYAVGHRKLTIQARWMAAVLAGGPGAVLSHRSAGEHWALVTRSGSIPEVTRPRGFKGRPGMRAHRLTLPPDEVEVLDGIPVTSVSRTLFDLAAVLSRAQLEQALNEAEVRQLTSRLSVPDLLRRHPGRRGAAALRAVLDDDEGGGITRLELERRFAALIDAHRLPRPRRNAHVAVRGRFFEVDFLWRSQRVAVELDGRAVHGTKRAFETDRERDRILLAEGWRPMRVTWRQLEDEPETIVYDLRGLLASRAAF
jgi:very-short-patch-repair endonuclease/predicted transcriptional regulator of viral defense system